MTTLLTKKELQAQIESIDTRIVNLKKLPTVTMEQHVHKQADLRKLDAIRGELLEKMKVAPE